MFSDRGLGPYGDFTSPERSIPKDTSDKDTRVRHKVWQVCDTIGTHWSYVPDEVYKDKNVLLHNVIDTVTKGGTIVLDAGPMPHGFFAQECVDTLEYIGRWLKVNGDAIYSTRLHTPYHEGETDYFTQSKDAQTVYIIHIGWPSPQFEVTTLEPKADSQIFMLGIKEPCPWHMEEGKLIIEIPPEFNNKIPCEYAYSFKVEMA